MKALTMVPLTPKENIGQTFFRRNGRNCPFPTEASVCPVMFQNGRLTEAKDQPIAIAPLLGIPYLPVHILIYFGFIISHAPSMHVALLVSALFFWVETPSIQSLCGMKHQFVVGASHKSLLVKTLGLASA